MEFDVLPVSVASFDIFHHHQGARRYPKQTFCTLRHTHERINVSFTVFLPPFDVRAQEIGFYRHYSEARIENCLFSLPKKNPRHNSVWLAQIYTAKSEKQNRCWQSQSENDKSKLACCVYVRYTEPSHPFFAFRQPYFAFRFLSIPHKKAYERSSSRKEIFLHALTMGP